MRLSYGNGHDEKNDSSNILKKNSESADLSSDTDQYDELEKQIESNKRKLQGF